MSCCFQAAFSSGIQGESDVKHTAYNGHNAATTVGVLIVIIMPVVKTYRISVLPHKAQDLMFYE